MRLLISAYACSPGRGSEPGNGWHWALGNALSGNEVWCLTTTEGKNAIEEEMLKYDDLPLHVVYVDAPRWLGYAYEFQPFVYLHYLVWQRKAAKMAVKLDSQINFDIVHHVTLGSFQLGSGLWRMQKPLIFGPVGGGNFGPRSYRKYFSGAWFMEGLRKLASAALLTFNSDVIRTVKQARLVLAANTDTLRMAEAAGAQKVKLFLDTALPVEFFPEQMPKHDLSKNVFKILWVGRIFARKGLRLVLEALSKVDKRIPFHLTIIGDGKQGHLLPSWLNEYGLAQRVTWYGQVTWHEVRKAYMEHDVFMFCSLRDSFGSQLLEAMAFGLPVITLNHHGAADHIPADAGIKVSVFSPDQTLDQLKQAVEFLYAHPEIRMALGKAGSQFAQQHTWPVKLQAINQIYRNALLHTDEEEEVVRELILWNRARHF